MDSKQEWLGQRLGLPSSGPGSIAKFGRRVLAIFIDWGAASLVSSAFFQFSGNATLLIFIVEQWLLVATLGYSLGHRVCGMAVRRLDGHWVGFWRSFIRVALICLVIPVSIWDADSRGLHDKAVGTVLVLAPLRTHS